MHRKTTLAAFAAALALWAGAARAAPPATITYSGFLTDDTGAAVTTATDLTFRFYDMVIAGSQIGTADVVTVTPSSDGYFSAIVGTSIAGFPALFDAPVWMSVQVQGDTGEMVPRIPITSVPSALSVAWTGVTGLPPLCATNQYLRGYDAAGSAVCQADPGGTITGISTAAGSGLSGGTASGTASLAVSFTASGGDNGIATTVARGDHAHDGRYYTETELNAAGTINAAANPVNWTKLKNVPAAFADGAVALSCTDTTTNTSFAAGGTGEATANCASGTMISGGFWGQGQYNDWNVVISRPWGNGWNVWAINNSAAAKTLTVYVRCCTVQ